MQELPRQYSSNEACSREVLVGGRDDGCRRGSVDGLIYRACPCRVAFAAGYRSDGGSSERGRRKRSSRVQKVEEGGDWVGFVNNKNGANPGKVGLQGCPDSCPRLSCAAQGAQIGLWNGDRWACLSNAAGVRVDEGNARDLISIVFNVSGHRRDKQRCRKGFLKNVNNANGVCGKRGMGGCQPGEQA
jgi:hypothetical protein